MENAGWAANAELGHRGIGPSCGCMCEKCMTLALKFKDNYALDKALLRSDADGWSRPECQGDMGE